MDTNEKEPLRTDFSMFSKPNFSNQKYIDLKMEFPYTCGTWFNRGKNTCNFIKEALEKLDYNINAHIHPFKANETNSSGNGYFNIYAKDYKIKDYLLISTSDEKNPKYNKGLKFFAYTFYDIDKSTGDPNYSDDYPYKNDLLNFVINSIKNKF
jgi:hypothetical protein